jgi:hypothetical protein
LQILLLAFIMSTEAKQTDATAQAAQFAFFKTMISEAVSTAVTPMQTNLNNLASDMKAMQSKARITKSYKHKRNERDCRRLEAINRVLGTEATQDFDPKRTAELLSGAMIANLQEYDSDTAQDYRRSEAKLITWIRENVPSTAPNGLQAHLIDLVSVPDDGSSNNSEPAWKKAKKGACSFCHKWSHSVDDCYELKNRRSLEASMFSPSQPATQLPSYVPAPLYQAPALAQPQHSFVMPMATQIANPSMLQPQMTSATVMQPQATLSMPIQQSVTNLEPTAQNGTYFSCINRVFSSVPCFDSNKWIGMSNNHNPVHQDPFYAWSQSAAHVASRDMCRPLVSETGSDPQFRALAQQPNNLNNSHVVNGHWSDVSMSNAGLGSAPIADGRVSASSSVQSNVQTSVSNVLPSWNAIEIKSERSNDSSDSKMQIARNGTSSQASDTKNGTFHATRDEKEQFGALELRSGTSIRLLESFSVEGKLFDPRP